MQIQVLRLGNNHCYYFVFLFFLGIHVGRSDFGFSGKAPDIYSALGITADGVY